MQNGDQAWNGLSTSEVAHQSQAILHHSRRKILVGTASLALQSLRETPVDRHRVVRIRGAWALLSLRRHLDSVNAMTH